jgi:Natural resistance-associated macrophage protein
MGYEKADLWIGIVLVIGGAIAMMAFSAATFAGTPEAGNFTNVGGTAAGLAKHVGQLPAVLFALALIDASIIGSAAVSLSTAYALSDVLSLNHSLHCKPSEAIGFYLVYGELIAGSATLVLIPGAPLGLVTEAVQTLAGVLLPSATVFLLLLCNDRAVIGPWVNGRWLNLFTGAVIAGLVLLSTVLTAAVLYPEITGSRILTILGAGTVLALIGWLVTLLLRPASDASGATNGATDCRTRANWRMPPLEELPPIRLTLQRRVWLIVLRGYLLLACGLVIFRVIEIARG